MTVDEKFEEMVRRFQAEKMDDVLWRRVVTIITEQLGVDEHQISHNAHIKDDLGADSLDVVEIVMAFEEEFDIEIPFEEENNLATINDVVGFIANYEPSEDNTSDESRFTEDDINSP